MSSSKENTLHKAIQPVIIAVLVASITGAATMLYRHELAIMKTNRLLEKQAVKDLGLPKGATIGGLIRNGEGILVTGNTMIQENDHVVVFCLGMMIKKLEKYF